MSITVNPVTTQSNTCNATQHCTTEGKPLCAGNDWAVSEVSGPGRICTAGGLNFGNLINCSSICPDTCPNIGGSPATATGWGENVNPTSVKDIVSSPAVICSYNIDQFKTSAAIDTYKTTFLRTGLNKETIARNQAILKQIQGSGIVGSTNGGPGTPNGGDNDQRNNTRNIAIFIGVAVLVIVLILLIAKPRKKSDVKKMPYEKTTTTGKR